MSNYIMPKSMYKKKKPTKPKKPKSKKPKSKKPKPKRKCRGCSKPVVSSYASSYI